MIVLLMGVAGSGKTTIGTLLAEKLRWAFVDADAYHSETNKAKMHAGIPLTDEDRGPWLQELKKLISHWVRQRTNVVLACSALKESYRKILLVDQDVKLVFLKGSFELIRSRIASRRDHFMSPQLLADQFQKLEPPTGAFAIDVTKPPQQIVNEIREALRI